MKKGIVFIILTLFTINIFAQTDSFEVSLSFDKKDAIGKSATYSKDALGVSSSFAYIFPKADFLGVKASANLLFPINETIRTSNWISSSFLAGLMFNLQASKNLSIRPELNYGVMLNSLNINNKQNLFVDQNIQGLISLKITPDSFQNIGLSFVLSQYYDLVIEQDVLLHSFGIKTGLIYQF